MVYSKDIYIEFWHNKVNYCFWVRHLRCVLFNDKEKYNFSLQQLYYVNNLRAELHVSAYLKQFSGFDLEELHV